VKRFCNCEPMPVDDFIGTRFIGHARTCSGIHGHMHRVCCPGIGATPEIDIWRATRLTLKRYGEPARDEGTTQVEALARAGEDNGAAAWPDHAAVTQTANTSCRPASSTHRRNNRVYGVSGVQRGKRSRMTPLLYLRHSPTAARPSQIIRLR